MKNWQETIGSQFCNSPILLALIESFNDAIDPTANIDEFIRLVLDVTTAEGYGLSVWGRIVGVSRTLTVDAAPGAYRTLGFDEGGTADYDPFNQSPFWGAPTSSGNFELTDDAFRTLILIKALSNISDTSIATYNKILLELFPGRGNTYVLDLGNMHMQLTFEFFLQPFELAILKQSGALLTPTGVGVSILYVEPMAGFGFMEASPSSVGFNQGTFFRGYA